MKEVERVDSEIDIELRYSVHKSLIKLRLDYKILFLMAKASVFVKENGGSFEPESQEITLLFRG